MDSFIFYEGMGVLPGLDGIEKKRKNWDGNSNSDDRNCLIACVHLI